MRPIAAFFWRRLDHPGYDSCRLFKTSVGWRLSGMAVFREERSCHLQYEVVTDRAWRSRRARITGFIGNRDIDVKISSAGAGKWRREGKVQKGLAGCIDLDLGFTPATNLIVLRRLSLKTGQRAEAPAAYLEFPTMRLVRLPQTYRRIDRSAYAYESPTAGYTGTLQVAPSGAVLVYPGLFELMR